MATRVSFEFGSLDTSSAMRFIAATFFLIASSADIAPVGFPDEHPKAIPIRQHTNQRFVESPGIQPPLLGRQDAIDSVFGPRARLSTFPSRLDLGANLDGRQSSVLR